MNMNDWMDNLDSPMSNELDPGNHVVVVKDYNGSMEEKIKDDGRVVSPWVKIEFREEDGEKTTDLWLKFNDKMCQEYTITPAALSALGFSGKYSREDNDYPKMVEKTCALLEQVKNEGTVYDITVKQNGKYKNVYVNRIVDGNEPTEDPTGFNSDEELPF